MAHPSTNQRENSDRAVVARQNEASVTGSSYKQPVTDHPP